MPGQTRNAASRKRAVARRRRPAAENEPARLADSVMKAFDNVGGQAWLEALAREDPKSFLGFLLKVLPHGDGAGGADKVRLKVTIGGDGD